MSVNAARIYSWRNSVRRINLWENDRTRKKCSKKRGEYFICSKGTERKAF